MANGPRFPNPLALLLAIVLVALLGVAAIALEQPSGEASGRVLDHQTNQPLAGARVTFSGPVTRTQITGRDGRYRFLNLPVGDYYASVKARRFDPQWHDGDVNVHEGQSASGVNFALDYTQPSLAVSNVQRVFTPNEPVRIALRGTQVPSFDVTLYRLDLPAAIAGARDLDALTHPDPAKLAARGLLQPLKTWHQAVTRAQLGDDDWFYTPVQMPKLPPGAYLASFSGVAKPFFKQPGGVFKDAYWFDVTRLALVAKRDRTRLLVSAVDLLDHRPVPNVALRAYDADGHVQTGSTDRDGLAWLASRGEHMWVLGTADGSSALVRSYLSLSSDAYRIYAYTDRPVYRPGQTVYLKAVVRARAGRGYATAAGAPVRLVLRDAQGNTLSDRTLTADAASDVATQFTLPQNAALGDTTIECSIDAGSYQTITFKVSDYRKPEFKVDITPAKTRYTLGETADVNLLATYYFGAPVPGAKLIATVYSAPQYWDRDPALGFYSGYLGDDDSENFWGYGDVVDTVEGTTDAQGRFHFTVPLKAAADDDWIGDRRFTVLVEGMDATKRPVKATQDFRVTQGDFRLDANFDASVYAPGQPLTVSLQTQDYQDQPIATPVQLSLVRLKYVQKTDDQGNEYTDTQRVPVATVAASTDAHGRAFAHLPAQSAGDYELDASAKDARGHTIQAQTYSWVAGDGLAADSDRSGGLQIVFDRKLYHPGDTAKVLIVSPVPNLSLLVTVEGPSLSAARLVRLHGTSTYFTLPVTRDYQPNAYVDACAVDGKQFMSAERSLNVLPEDKFLQVAVQTDKPRYQPGDTATYTITTRDAAGRPVAADVSLGIVDEAIYAIAPDLTPDIRGFFHGPGDNLVSTSYSFPEEYSGGLDKFAADPRVRSNFQDTAAWFPELHTGADGRVQVRVKLPDNLTTWVATVRAATPGTRVGAATQDVVATKDLLVRLEVPRFLVAGDRVHLTAIVHNYTPQAQPVRVRLEASGLQLEDSRAQTVTIQPGDAQRVGWWATASQLGTAQVTAIAQGTTAADAMRLPVPVQPFGLERFVPLAGTASATSPYATTLTVPAGAIPSRTTLTLRLNQTPLPAILGAVDYLQQYPFWCVEQTMSRLVPAVAIAPRLERLGAPVGDRFADAQSQVSQGLARLVGLQHGDGGWGWWQFDDSNPEMTAYVLEGLAEARRAGDAVPQDAATRGVAYLKRTLPTIKHDLYTRHVARSGAGADARAFALLALADWNAAPASEIDRLYADRAGLSNYGLAQFTWLLERQGDARAASLMATLRAHADVSATQIDWTADAPAFSWQDDSVGATAYALEALLAERPSDPWIPAVVRWLTSKNAHGYWQSTKDSAIAAIALSDELLANPPADASGGATLSLGGAPVASATLNPGDAWQGVAPLTVGMGPLRAGDNALTLAASGAALPFSGGLSTFEQLDSIPAAPAPGLSVSRDYYRLPAALLAKAQGEGGFAQYYDDRVVSHLTPLGDQVASGERVLVRLTVTNDRPMRYLALSDPLPAGCEVLDDQPTNWGYWWDGQEFHDDRAVFFFGALAPGTHHCYYVMRPTTAGQYRVLPSRIWAMYRPEVSAHAADGRLTVTE